MLTPLGRAATKVALKKPQKKHPRRNELRRNETRSNELRGNELRGKKQQQKPPKNPDNKLPPRRSVAKNRKEGEGKRDKILDAAETAFARSGYDGASMRQISRKAGVAQALIHYHFETKEKLFEEVVGRRSQEINRVRSERLKSLLKASRKPRLKDVADALLRPTIEVGHRLAHSTSDFSRILVTIANSTDKRSTRLAQAYYDPIALQFISAFEKTVPKLSRENAVWAYMFSIGVGMTMMAQTGRPQRLSDGVCDDTDVEAMLARVLPFITAGIRAVAGVGPVDQRSAKTAV